MDSQEFEIDSHKLKKAVVNLTGEVLNVIIIFINIS